MSPLTSPAGPAPSPVAVSTQPLRMQQLNETESFIPLLTKTPKRFHSTPKYKQLPLLRQPFKSLLPHHQPDLRRRSCRILDLDAERAILPDIPVNSQCDGTDSFRHLTDCTMLA